MLYLMFFIQIRTTILQNIPEEIGKLTGEVKSFTITLGGGGALCVDFIKTLFSE